MQSLPYIPGLRPIDPGPLSRFMPPLEEGVAAAWLSQHVAPPSWVLDPFGFAPRLPLEAARSGYRVLVTANNPITRFLIEMAAGPPPESDFKAALAELAVSKKGDERLEAHLQALYLTRCDQCGQEVLPEAFLWRKGEPAPYARIYECKACGDKGERLTTPEDIERSKRIAATDGLHRSRALERVAALDDADRVYAEEALQHYLPRPLYVLTTIINRLDSLSLSPSRRRALTALLLVACDAGNTLWGHPAERPRPKQLSTPNQFREHNLWLTLERSLSLWSEQAAGVPCVIWPKRLPESGGICIYEGRLRDLAHHVKKEIPIAAVIGSIPRPNQAFWTLSALWAGWLWGREAVEPYKAALRRRRYDWAWNATALYAAFTHLFELLALGTPFFGLLADAEPSFLTSVLTASSAAGFELKGMALRSESDPIQMEWERGERLKRESALPDAELARAAIEAHLVERGEPVGYLHLHAAALAALSETHALKTSQQEFDQALRTTHNLIETVLKDARFVHYGPGEGLESGLWDRVERAPSSESLADRVEMTIVSYLQEHPQSIYLEVEERLCTHFTGLLTPPRELIYAVLHSYAEKEGALWKLRPEDQAAARREDLHHTTEMLKAIGERLHYRPRAQDHWMLWEEQGEMAYAFCILASACVDRAIARNPYPPERTLLVLPGGRAALLAFKQQRDPSLAERMKAYRVVKYRLVRALFEVPILTRETFLEQIVGDPIEQAKGQMMMF